MTSGMFDDKILSVPDGVRDLDTLDPDALEAAIPDRGMSPSGGLPSRIAVDPASVERGLARLVLSLVELIRQLMERQAIRRVEAGGLDDATIERLGETLMRLDSRMDALKATFGLSDADLRLDLGPVDDLDR
ncbi:gas vesicle protein GvpK [Eilatimonas milleporae]|uniref:Gas vesicle protein GvpK n=2 Tax=Eilatimonas milleporae TaxID=911205 RepID=A0A3M0CS66_9PROT|nr:gas vesicle protein K [Eilatimonas milleporae]RMB12372.1 gas vesicle protein GvpK [Eilatimonas milleporae]